MYEENGWHCTRGTVCVYPALWSRQWNIFLEVAALLSQTFCPFILLQRRGFSKCKLHHLYITGLWFFLIIWTFPCLVCCILSHECIKNRKSKVIRFLKSTHTFCFHGAFPPSHLMKFSEVCRYSGFYCQNVGRVPKYMICIKQHFGTLLWYQAELSKPKGRRVWSAV